MLETPHEIVAVLASYKEVQIAGRVPMLAGIST
jgi:hypothetical protein